MIKTTQQLDAMTTQELRDYISEIDSTLMRVEESEDWKPGITLSTTNATDYVEFTFFGTGFDFRTQFDTTNSDTILVQLDDGSGLTNLTTANFPTASFSTYGVVSKFNSTTAILDTSNGSLVDGGGFITSDLPLGQYTVRLTNNTGAAKDLFQEIHKTTTNQ